MDAFRLGSSRGLTPVMAAVVFWGFLAAASGHAQVASQSIREEVLAAMAKATGFMMDKVADKGGFLWHYSSDLSRKWGEIPARDSQIWVQPPSTPTVGAMLVDAYKATGDKRYREYAGKTADVLIWGQGASGGWHYFIDFDPAGVREWNAEAPNNFRGWEEFYHYYGNATFDDDTTTSAIRFLLRLYNTTLDAKYRPAVLLGIEFVLEAQYKNGAWPQRFPLKPEYSHDGRPDYSVHYTFNDGVAANNIYLLWEAYETLGDERYLTAARTGMDFYFAAQLPEPQAGWAQQYSFDLKPAWGRSYEPSALCTAQTLDNIRDLQEFYRLTGDRRFLRPIPAALDWLQRSVIPSLAPRATHAFYYEVGSNAPLYPHHVVKDGKIDHYVVNHEPSFMQAHSATMKIDVEKLRQQYEVLASQSPEEIKASRPTEHGRPSPETPSREEVSKLIQSLDSRGAWLSDIEVIDTGNYVDNPPFRFRGIDTRTYVRNMYRCLAFLSAEGESK
ncbi:MAG: pectate lyase [Bryobacterales bacterium]